MGASDFKYKPTTALYKIKALFRAIAAFTTFIIQGGQGAGKTISILMLIIDLCLRSPGKKVSIISDELSKMKRTVIRDFLEIIKDWNIINKHGTWNKTDNTFYWHQGGFIEFLGLDTHDVGKGMRRDLVYFNEANKLKLEAYRQVASRSKINIIDFNPDSYFWAHDLVNGENFINLTYKDNEALPKEEVAAIEEYYKKGYDAEGKVINEYWANIWRVYGLGEIGSVEGRIFTHAKKCTYSEFLTLPLRSVYGVDWGKNHGFGIVQTKYDRYTNNYYTHELNWLSENKLIASLSDKDRALINSDSSGGIIIYMMNKLSIPKDAYIICDSARPDNILLLRKFGWEYAAGIDKPKGSVMANISQMQSVNWFYTDCSKGIDFEQQNYQYRKDRMGVIDDEVVKENDDLIDPSMYALRWTIKNP